MSNLELIKSSIRTIPNFPKQGIMFKDITTLLGNSEALCETMNSFYQHYKNYKIDAIAGIESRGFIFGAPLAYELGKKFIPIRKPGKLPYKTIKENYDLEYGKNCIEIHEDAIKPGERILIIDDLLATGGTAKAAANLVEKLGGEVAGFGFVVELPDLKGREKISGWDVYSLVSFNGE